MNGGLIQAETGIKMRFDVCRYLENHFEIDFQMRKRFQVKSIE